MLTLDGTEIKNGTINDGNSIVVAGASKIDGISGTNAALNNGAVTVNAALTLDNVTVSGTVITDNASIELDDNVTLTGGAKIQGASSASKGAVTNLGTLEVSGAATLLNDTLTNTGHTVQVDGTGVLTLDGTEIKNGTINDGNSIVVAGASKIDGISGTNAALNNGAVTVNAALTLDNVTVSGTVITDNASIELDRQRHADRRRQDPGGRTSASKGAVTNLGTLEVSGAATLLNDTLTNTGHTIQVDGTGVLTLDGTEIKNGTINDGNSIVVAGASKIDGISGTNAALNNGAVTVNAALTLDNVTVSGTVITDNASIELDDNVTLTGGAKIQGASSASKGAITNLGTLEVSGAATLLNDTLTNTGHTVQVDGTGVLTLDGTAISGGFLNNIGSVTSSGISALTDVNITNTATIEVTSGTLTIDPAPFTNTGVLQAVTGGTLDLSGEDDHQHGDRPRHLGGHRRHGFCR